MPRTLPICAIALLTALPASADALLQKAKAQSKDGPLYAFTMEVDDGTNRFTATVDPSRPEGERVVALTPDPAGLTGDAARRAERLRKETEGDIWCAGLVEDVPDTAKRVSETATSATYAFTPKPADKTSDMAKIAKHLEGRTVIDKASGQVLSFEMSAPRPFKPAMVAKVDRFSLKVACRPAPDGRTHIDSFSMSVAGSAMMQAFDQTERRSISALTPLVLSGYGAP